MLDSLRHKWRTSTWFKITIILVIILYVAGIYLQAGYKELGTTVEGFDHSKKYTKDESLVGNPGEIMVFSANISEIYFSIAFAADTNVEFYIFDSIISPDLNVSTLENIAAGSIANGRVEKYSSTYVDHSSVSLILVFEVTTYYIYSFVQFKNDEVTNLVKAAVGGFLKAAANFIIALYIIFGVFIPWSRNRSKHNDYLTHNNMNYQEFNQQNQTNYEQPNENTKFCIQCGNMVGNQKFCNNCGNKLY